MTDAPFDPQLEPEGDLGLPDADGDSPLTTDAQAERWAEEEIVAAIRTLANQINTCMPQTSHAVTFELGESHGHTHILTLALEPSAALLLADRIVPTGGDVPAPVPGRPDNRERHHTAATALSAALGARGLAGWSIGLRADAADRIRLQVTPGFCHRLAALIAD